MLLRRRWQPVLLASLGIFLFFSGALYFQSVLPTDDAGYLGYYNDSGTAAIRGTVCQQPDERDQTTRLRLSGLAIETEGGWPQVQGGYPTVRPQIPTI